MDGALIACESAHWLKRNKKPAALVKLDFHKAYYMVRWDFVDLVRNGGFGSKHVLLQEQCLFWLMVIQQSRQDRKRLKAR